MIIKITKREAFNGTGSVKYEFIEGDNIISVGEVLNASQKENLKYWGNTVISKSMYDALGATKLKREIERLMGFSIKFEIKTHAHDEPTVLVLKK